jgi:hypothetical protein
MYDRTAMQSLVLILMHLSFGPMMQQSGNVARNPGIEMTDVPVPNTVFGSWVEWPKPIILATALSFVCICACVCVGKMR